MKKGIKYDMGKEDWNLLPLEPARSVIRVLMYGAEKYSVDNWKRVRPRERYFSAALRHITARMDGELLDRESGHPHLSHAICCLFFALWHDLRKGRASV